MSVRTLTFLLIAGGAIVLPLLAFGHGSEFLDAKFFFDPTGTAHLEVTADYAGNPMLASEAEARAALTNALHITLGDREHPLTDLAPLTITHRDQPDPESPAPRGPEDPQTPHQLLTARWQWHPTPATKELHFVVPKTSAQTLLFWMREPNVTPPRWTMLIPGDTTPTIQAPSSPTSYPWPLLILLVPLAIPILSSPPSGSKVRKPVPSPRETERSEIGSQTFLD